jgi:hypothetical protein
MIPNWPARRDGHYRLVVGSGVSTGPLGFIKFVGERVSHAGLTNLTILQ